MKPNLKLLGKFKQRTMGLTKPSFVALAVLLFFAAFFPTNVWAATAYIKENAPEFIENTRGAYGEMVNTAALLNDGDRRLILAVIIVESEGNERAVSRRGAQGLMQLMPKTAKSMGAKNPKEPLQNILAGTKYLKELEDNYGFHSPAEALVAYNMGPAGARKWLAKHSALEYGYVSDVLYVYHALEDKEVAEELAAKNAAKTLADQLEFPSFQSLIEHPHGLSLTAFPMTIPSTRRNDAELEN